MAGSPMERQKQKENYMILQYHKVGEGVGWAKSSKVYMYIATKQERVGPEGGGRRVR